MVRGCPTLPWNSVSEGLSSGFFSPSLTTTLQLVLQSLAFAMYSPASPISEQGIINDCFPVVSSYLICKLVKKLVLNQNLVTKIFKNSPMITIDGLTVFEPLKWGSLFKHLKLKDNFLSFNDCLVLKLLAELVCS